MATQRVIGLYVLGALLFVLIIVCNSYSVNTIEEFASKPKKEPRVPSVCGTHGYFNKNMFNPKDIPDQRLYTQSQCDALKGVLRYGNQCLKLYKREKDEDGNYNFAEENIKINYNNICGGLNYQATARPSECGSVGKPNVEIKITINGKKTKILANSVMLYTQDECEDTLQGNFINIQTAMDRMNKTTRKELVALWGGTVKELNEAIKANGGDEMGFCNSSDSNTQPNFSQACTGSGGLLGGVGGMLDKFLNWLKSFF